MADRTWFFAIYFLKKSAYIVNHADIFENLYRPELVNAK